MKHNTSELLLRFLFGFLPLLVVTYQVMMLRRILRSRAWTLLAASFVVFLLLQVFSLFFEVHLFWRIVISGIGFGLMALGNHTLRDDLYRILRPRGENDRRRY